MKTATYATLQVCLHAMHKPCQLVCGVKKKCRAELSKPNGTVKNAVSPCESTLDFMCRLLEERTTPTRQGSSDSKMLLTGNPKNTDSPPSTLSHQQPGIDQLKDKCLKPMHDMSGTYPECIRRLLRHSTALVCQGGSGRGIYCAACQHVRTVKTK